MEKYLISLFLLSAPALIYSQTTIDFFKQGDAKFRIEDYHGAIAEYEKAIDVIRPVYIEINPQTGAPNPQYAIASYKIGLAESKLNNYHCAIACFTKAIDGIDNVSFSKSDRFLEAFFNRGLAKINLKDYKGAVNDFDESIEIDPKYAEAFYYRGLIKTTQLGEIENGCVDLIKARDLGSRRAIDDYKKYCN